jgi:hypothetical protein
MRKPIFGNIQILNLNGLPFGSGRNNDGKPLITKGIARLKHVWDRENKDWKPMASLKFQLHLANMSNEEKINMSGCKWDSTSHTHLFLDCFLGNILEFFF